VLCYSKDVDAFLLEMGNQLMPGKIGSMFAVECKFLPPLVPSSTTQPLTKISAGRRSSVSGNYAAC
jgi:hypothetical protein